MSVITHTTPVHHQWPVIGQGVFQVARRVEHFVSNALEPVQGSAKRHAPCLVEFIPAVAYHFCLALPTAFTQPGAHLLAGPCISASPAGRTVQLLNYGANKRAMAQ